MAIAKLKETFSHLIYLNPLTLLIIAFIIQGVVLLPIFMEVNERLEQKKVAEWESFKENHHNCTNFVGKNGKEYSHVIQCIGDNNDLNINEVTTLYTFKSDPSSPRYHINRYIIFPSGRVKTDDMLTALLAGHYVCGYNDDTGEYEECSDK